MGRFVAEAFSGTVIDAVRYEGDVLVGDVIEGHLLWNELADEAVHVFVGSMLPGCAGVGEVEVGPQLFGDSLVLSELLTDLSRYVAQRRQWPNCCP